jgi:hypothetical protein
VNRFRFLFRLEKTPIRLSTLPANRQAGRSLKPILYAAIRAMAPTLLALSFAGAAHAQGTMDFSGATTLMSTFKTFAIYAGAVICFGGLIFAGIRMLSGRFQDAIPGLFGALFGAGVLGWGAGWIGIATGAAGRGPHRLLPRGVRQWRKAPPHPAPCAAIARVD